MLLLNICILIAINCYVQSLDSKVDEMMARVAFQRDIRDCNILCFTETWLSGDMLSESVQPPGFFARHANTNKHLSGKKGGGVCFMITTHGVIVTTNRNSCPFVHLT
jgi:hypothetical protein